MKVVEFYQNNKLKTWFLILTAPTLILIVGSLALPDLFWDGFLFRYFWGPVVADARGEPVNGIAEGYNWVNTLVYGVLVSFSLLGIYEIIDHYKIEVDRNFVISLLPWLLLGGSLRALEDAGFFTENIAPFFISPVIYFVLGISAILTMVLGCRLEDLVKFKRFVVLTPPLIIFLIMRLEFYMILSIFMITVLALFYFIGIKYDWSGETYLFSSYGVSLLTVSLIYCSYFIITLEGSNPWEVPIILGLSLLSTTIFTLGIIIIKKLDVLKSTITSLSMLNILIAFAHFFDASSTYRGIQYHGYIEKHVLPNLLIEITGTPLVMYALKLFLIVTVIYVLDVSLREELKDLKGLTVLVKFVLIVLGLSPGFRNMLRLAMGV